MAQDGERKDPFAGFNFRMEIDGVEVAGFKEVKGSGMSTEVIQYAEGDEENAGIKKIPGRTHFTNAIFKRGIAEGVDLWEWCTSVNDYPRAIERKSITINLLDNDGESQKTYTLLEAWPCRYSIDDFNASNDELAMEEIEFVYESLEIED